MKGFAFLQVFLTTLVLLMGIAIWGIAAAPGVALVLETLDYTTGMELWLRCVLLGLSIGGAYLIWGLDTLAIVGIFGILIRPRLPEAKVPLYSYTTVRWAFFSVFHRLTKPFLQHMVPSWIADLYFRLMGCKIGKGAQINSYQINDCYMIDIGKDVIIGGNAEINGHITEKNELVLAPVKIGDGALIGANAFIGPGVIIGAGAVVATHALVPKFTEIPPGEIWAGIPARCIRLADGSKPE